MKKPYILFLLFVSIFMCNIPAFAATVGNPIDLDIPPKSSILRQQAVNQALDEYEEMVKIKGALDLEFIFNKDLRTPMEVKKAELKGQWHMVKLGTTIFNRVEPYIKIGTSDLTAEWTQDQGSIEVGAETGFAWGAGIKGVIKEFENSGLRLTGDIQYRTTEPDTDECSIAGRATNSTGGDFKIEEWQLSLVASKKFELPLKWQNIYIVPYTGINISDSIVDVSFRDPDAPTADYSVFDAGNDEIIGLLIGCDIMPTLTSSFIYSMEVRLMNETALTLGGAIKF